MENAFAVYGKLSWYPEITGNTDTPNKNIPNKKAESEFFSHWLPDSYSLYMQSSFSWLLFNVLSYQAKPIFWETQRMHDKMYCKFWNLLTKR